MHAWKHSWFRLKSSMAWKFNSRRQEHTYLPLLIPTLTYTYLYLYLPLFTPTFAYTYLYLHLPLLTPTFSYTYLYLHLPLLIPTFTYTYLYLHLPLPMYIVCCQIKVDLIRGNANMISCFLMASRFASLIFSFEVKKVLFSGKSPQTFLKHPVTYD